MNNYKLITSILTATIFLGGCAGGTMGTGVRKYGDSLEIEDKTSPWFNFYSHAAFCKIKGDQGEKISMSLTPIVGEVDADVTSTSSCKASFIPASHTLTLLLAKNGEPIQATKFELQSRTASQNSDWIVEKSGTSEIVPDDSKFSHINISANTLVPSKTYRAVVFGSASDGKDLVFEFSLASKS